MRGDKKYFSLALFIVTILSVLFYHFIHLEKATEIESAKANINRINDEIVLIKNFNSKHKDIDEEVSILAERHYRATEAFPEKLNEEIVIDYLRKVSQNNKLEIVTLNMGELKKDSKNTANFNVKIRGNYFNVLDFLMEIYNGRKFIDIRGVDLKNNDGILTLNLDINCYYSDMKGEK